MEQIQSLIVALGQCIPELNTDSMQASLPENSQQLTVLTWMYNHLSGQGLISYEEWNEYSGYIPTLKPLSNLVISEDPADFIFSLIEDIDCSVDSIDPFEMPHLMPWINNKFQPISNP